jgi:transcriptional regulator with XRE-family HTH domain
MISKKIADKLQDQEYRTAFVASQINVGIPFQIKALMKARGWTQEQLAERTGMLQPRISAVLKPGKVRPNIETLRRFAEAFDCGLLVRFAPFSELTKWSESFDPEKFDVPQFDADPGFKESDKAAVANATDPYYHSLTRLLNPTPEHFRSSLDAWQRQLQSYLETNNFCGGNLKDLASMQYRSACPAAFASSFAPSFEQTCNTPTMLTPTAEQSTHLKIVYRNTSRWRTVIQNTASERKGVDYINTVEPQERIA